jgi:hypothetical protein
MELSGFLLKQGAKGLFKGWKKRWCRFKFGKLFYSETQTDAQPLGFIDVDSCSDVRGVFLFDGRECFFFFLTFLIK